jgi:molybdopterin-containing oxidoreductase family iron-sulfur binding subunit
VEGSRLAFGEYVDTQYTIEKADVILSLDADFMSTSGSGVRHARAFASRRRVESTRDPQPAVRRRKHAHESAPRVRTIGYR